MSRLTTHQSVMGRNRKHDIAYGMGSMWLKKIGKYKYELIEEVIDKLGQLEDIEERTCIPFSQIASLEIGDKVYVLYGSQIHEGLVSSINYDELFITILVGETFVDYMLFNQYGKNRKSPMHCWTGAWALTKEELE